MAAHRYWRATGLVPYLGPALELAEFHLLAGGVRVDAPAVLSSNVVPDSGSLAALKDDDLTTRCRWESSDGLSLSWDFGGSPVDVGDIRLASSAAGVPSAFLLSCTLWWSDDGAAWMVACRFWGIAWPGARTKTSSRMGFPRTPENEAVQVLMDFEAPPSGWKNLAFMPTSIGVVGTGSSRSSVQAKFGTYSYAKVNSNDYLRVDGLSYAGEDFTLEAWTYFTGATTTAWAHAAQVGTALTNRMNFGVYNGFYVLYSQNPSGAVLNPGTGAPVIPNAWVHLALVKSGSTFTLYRNGVSIYSGTSTAGLAAFSGGSLALGYQQFSATSTDSWIGYLDDVCLTYSAVYAGPFTPPAAPRAASVSTIVTNPVMGRAAALPALSVGSAGAASDYAGARLKANWLRARPDFVTGTLGQGIGRVRGFTLDYVNPLNKPYPCRVRLVRESDGLQLREVWSGADGSYDFQFVDELQSYTVIAYYLAHGKRAVVTDGLTLANGKVELMP